MDDATQVRKRLWLWLLTWRTRSTSPTFSPYYLRQDRRGAHMRLLALVPAGRDALDVGCASGYLARLLVERGYQVIGVEIDPAAAEEARAFCAHVYETSAEDLNTLPLLPGMYDVVLFGDVLEHLTHPERALRGARTLVKPEGKVLLTVPNIAHYSVRFNLLFGRFNYTRDGLLDATHVRFFTRRSIAALARECGFTIETEDVTQGSPIIFLGHLLRKLQWDNAPFTRWVDATDLWLSRRFPGLFGFQHLLVLRPETMPDALREL